MFICPVRFTVNKALVQCFHLGKTISSSFSFLYSGLCKADQSGPRKSTENKKSNLLKKNIILSYHNSVDVSHLKLCATSKAFSKKTDGLAMETLTKVMDKKRRTWTIPFPMPLPQHQEGQSQPSTANIQLRIQGFFQAPSGSGLQLTTV